MTTRKRSLHTFKTRLARPVIATAAALAVAGAAAPTGRGTEARLRATADGYALLSSDGHVMYEASGPAARTACLRRATETGVLRIAR